MTKKKLQILEELLHQEELELDKCIGDAPPGTYISAMTERLIVVKELHDDFSEQIGRIYTLEHLDAGG